MRTTTEAGGAGKGAIPTPEKITAPEDIMTATMKTDLTEIKLHNGRTVRRGDEVDYWGDPKPGTRDCARCRATIASIDNYEGADWITFTYGGMRLAGLCR